MFRIFLFNFGAKIGNNFNCGAAYSKLFKTIIIKRY